MGRYLGSFARFDREEFWEACIELDLLWREEPSDYCQGLIFLAAGYCHLQRRNLTGCRKLLELAIEYLAPFAYAHRTSSVAMAVQQALGIARMLRAGAEDGHIDSIAYGLPHILDGGRRKEVASPPAKSVPTDTAGR